MHKYTGRRAKRALAMFIAAALALGTAHTSNVIAMTAGDAGVSGRSSRRSIRAP